MPSSTRPASRYEVADLSGRFVEMNRKFSDVLGYSADELRQITFDGSSLTRTISPRRRPQYASCSKGAIPVLAREALRPKGSVHRLGPGERHVAEEMLPAGPQQFIGVIEDITLRKCTEDALREETRILERLNESGRALASQLDLQATTRGVTDAATESVAPGSALSSTTRPRTSGDNPSLHGSRAHRARRSCTSAIRADDLLAATIRGEGPLRFDDVLAGRRFPPRGRRGEQPARGGLPVRSYLAVPVRSRPGAVIGGLVVGHPDPASSRNAVSASLPAWRRRPASPSTMHVCTRRHEAAERARRTAGARARGAERGGAA